MCNVDEASAAAGNAMSRKVEEKARAEGAGCVVISAKIEAEFAGLAPQDRDAFLHDLGLEEAGLNRLIREGYRVLGPDHLLHGRPQGGARLDRHPRHQGGEGGRHHPHRLREGLHPRRDHRLRRFRLLGGELPAKEAGKMRLEGKDYVVKDGDVMHFRFAN